MSLVHKVMPLGQMLRKAYWRVVKPTSLGVRAVLVDDREQVMLVRHSYTGGWYLPGGRVRRRETMLDGLWRELQEEVGLDSEQTSAPTLLGVYASAQEGKRDHIAVFVVRGAANGDVRGLEVSGRQLFPLDALPADVSPGTRRRLEEFRGARQVDYTW